MKKASKIFLFLFVTVMTLLIGLKDVNAKTEAYYTNDKGVNFTEEQYDFFTRLYWDGYQNYMTQEMLDSFSDIDFSNAKIEKVSLCPQTRGNFVESQYKGLTMANVCGAMCRAVLNAEWFVEPNTKSYDVIGMYFYGPTRIGTPSTMIAADGSGGFEETTKYEEDGFGAIVKIPDGAKDITISQTMAYQGTGTINGSYQHAMNPISFKNSQKFHIDIGGYGGVFDFYGEAYGKYDHFPGVDIDV